MKTTHAGVIVVRRVAGGKLEVAVHVRPRKGYIFHRVSLGDGAPPMPARVMAAVAGYNHTFGTRVAADSVIENLSFADLHSDRSLCSEHHVAIVEPEFSHRKRGSPYAGTEWIPVDMLFDDTHHWSWYQMPFVRQLKAVLCTMQETYTALASHDPAEVQRVHAAHALCSVARGIVIRANRHDLLFGVAVRGLRHGIEGDAAWYEANSISWLANPEHQKASVVNRVLQLAMAYQVATETCRAPIADGPTYLATLEHALYSCHALHLEVFGTPPHDLAADLWRAAAHRLTAPTQIVCSE